ncbi:uncharacterized protein LOC114844742 [Betta splendens]|uniref:Uncharacterized protein LOC114844742 n=1 Tax=Betta splendens TaxID=158456 RepID=A0A6P7L0I8_BETSP|nr:uncharacterized protein LOC114844742 [Betta splendens]
MQGLGFLLLVLSKFCRGFPVPVDTVVVQVQQWGVVGAQHSVQQVLLNGLPLTGTSQEVHSVIQSMLAESLLPAVIGDNQTSVPKNHTVLRSRECILEGSQLHWADRVFYDGKLYLTLDRSNTWTAHTTEAQTLKGLWDQDVQHTRMERMRLEEGCSKLVKELRLSEELSVSGFPLPKYLILILAVLAFIGLIMISILLSKKSGLRHPGGVVGSIIHYPKDMAEMATEIKGSGYSTL